MVNKKALAIGAGIFGVLVVLAIIGQKPDKPASDQALQKALSADAAGP